MPDMGAGNSVLSSTGRAAVELITPGPSLSSQARKSSGDAAQWHSTCLACISPSLSLREQQTKSEENTGNQQRKAMGRDDIAGTAVVLVRHPHSSSSAQSRHTVQCESAHLGKKKGPPLH